MPRVLIVYEHNLCTVKFQVGRRLSGGLAACKSDISGATITDGRSATHTKLVGIH